MRKIILISITAVMLMSGGSIYAWPWGKTEKSKAEEKAKPEAHIVIEKPDPHKPLGTGTIKFIDENGEIIKEIWIGKKVIYIGQEKKQKRVISVEGVISQDGRFAIVAGEQSLEGELLENDVLYFIDSRGQVLWESKFSDEVGTQKLKISDNTRVIAVQEGKEFGVDVYLNIFSKDGVKLLKFPGDKYQYSDVNDYKLSPNGRYLVINTYNTASGGYKNTTVFFDLEDGKFWDSEERYRIKRIGNNGIGNVGYFDPRKSIEINLKEKFTK